jgi:mannitol/fructose-specific phosphotransferase system IIA component (Ntr-type)
MRLSRYLRSDHTIIGLEAEGVDDTIRAMVARLADAGPLDTPDLIAEAVIERESSHTTSLGNGVALPHATVPGVTHPLILVATAPQGIPFGPDSEADPDRLFFLLLSPIDAAVRHIKILARIVRLVRRPDFVDALLAAETGDDLVAEIEREDALHV